MSPSPAGPAFLNHPVPPGGVLADGVFGDGAKIFQSFDKYTGTALAYIAAPSREQVARIVGSLSRAVERGAPPPVERARVLFRAADLMRERREHFAEIITAETGFTLVDARGEVDRTIVTLTLCAEEATRIVGETVAFGATAGQHDRLGFTIRVPVGIVCAITPFNAPLNTVVHKIGPALAAGNAVVLKPSGFTPLTAALLCQLLLDAGLSPEFLALVHGLDADVGAWLLEEQAIAFYSFTGSTRVGRAIQQGAGLRRCQLELGSIASTLVCGDADLDRAVPKIANATFRKAGQVCTSIQRLYVERPVVGDLLQRLTKEAEAMPAGDPRDARTRVGPMISEASAERAEQWIREATLGQARVITGGTRERAVLAPTILTEVQDGMKVIDEEIFAPCVSIIPFDGLDEAIAHANNTPFGLAAGIFTRDLNQAMRAARTLRFGAIHVNESSSTRGDAQPFGGVKHSGYGHEGPKYAIREVTEERLVTLNF